MKSRYKSKIRIDRRRRVMRARNRTILIIAGVFLLFLAGYSINRWAIPHAEGPINAPASSAAPSEAPQPAGTPEASSSSAPATAESTAPESSAPATATAQILENGYQSAGLSFTCEKKETENDGQAVHYLLADIHNTDISLLRGAFASDDGTLRGVYKNPVELAEKNGALLAINTENAGYLKDGIVVRNGLLYRFAPRSKESCCLVYVDGSMKIVTETDFASQDDVLAEIEKGLLHSFSFGPALIKDGQTCEGLENHKIQTWNPRTAIGMIEPGHLVFIVVDGRTAGTYSAGMRLIHLEQVMRDLGCTQAYNLDGGASSIMIFNGEILNNIAGRDNPRDLTDILYLAKPN